MACFHPMPAVRLSDGSVKFISRNKRGVVGDLELPCGQCIGCRLERSRQWAMRCMHEASLHDSNLFVTLTYADEHLPPGGSLRYRDFQLFMKRLRKRFGNVSFYVGGEYGETTRRPHFHVCLFNLALPDAKFLCRSEDGSKVYGSELLDQIWGLGGTSFGSVTFKSAAYVARYCVQKVTGQAADLHYRVVDSDGEVHQLVPEFNRMSLNPAVGKRWLEKFHAEVYPRDYVIVNGTKVRPPKFYDRWFEAKDEKEFLFIKSDREQLTYSLRSDNTPDRLLVKETIAHARLSMLKRNFL